MEWIVIKSLLSLAAIIALMIGVVFTMKKYMYGGRASSADIVDMKVIGTMMLQPKRSVSVLKVMNKVLIIGVTEDGMQTLGEISDEKSMKHIEEKLPEPRVQTKWFAKKSESSSSVPFAEALSIQLNRVVAKGSE